MIDDRDGWRVLQQWYIRAVRERIHAAWLEAAVLSRAIPRISVADYVARPAYYQSVTWKPRGWSWVDPTKEVNAYKEAEKAGYVTKSDVIAQTGNGRDIEDVIRERRRELDMMEAAGLTTDTDPGADQPVQAAPEPADDDERPVRLRLAKREKP